MNILVVDDQVDVVRGILSGVNWRSAGGDRVYPAYSAAEAQEILASHRVDILLCDIEMPEKNGLELFRWVRENYSEIECIFLTAHAEFEYAREALRLGSFGYILQPARYEEIGEMVAQAADRLRRRQREKQALAHWRDKREVLLDTCVRGFVTGTAPDAERFLADLTSLGYPLPAGAIVTPVLIRLPGRAPDGARLPNELTDSLAQGGALLASLDAREYLVRVAAARSRPCLMTARPPSMWAVRSP